MQLKYLAGIIGLASTSIFAQDVNLSGTITVPIKPPVQAKATNAGAEQVRKIKLLKFNLSDKAKQTLANKAQDAVAKTKQFSANAMNSYGKYPPAVQLGMNNVPVLNQGMHGTCVTFAVTAALDAAFKQGDYISQLCSLQLGNYLQENAYTMSGWDGTLGRFALSQMDTYGFIAKDDQKANGCGGLIDYPTTDEADPSSYMSVEEYHKFSQPIIQDWVQVVWSPILDVYDAFMERVDTNKTLAGVKDSLAHGDRVTFGVLLLDFDLGVAGAVGKKGDSYDSWVLTPEIARDAVLQGNFGGHEMVITGYDDNAVAVDDSGVKHKGLLTLRNSWSSAVGDHGDFYMSYDYFKLLVIEAQRIRAFDWGDMDDDDDDAKK